MTDRDPDRHEVRLTATALRALARIPPRVADPLVAFMFGSLAENPQRRGAPLGRDLAGFHAARRGDYRVIYEISDDNHTVVVLSVAHRADA